jgi:hypothetical protein
MAHGGRRKRGEEGRDEGGDVNGAGCAAPPLAATTIHQRVEATWRRRRPTHPDRRLLGREGRSPPSHLCRDDVEGQEQKLSLA